MGVCVCHSRGLPEWLLYPLSFDTLWHRHSVCPVNRWPVALSGLFARAHVGGMQFQRLLERGVGLLLLTQAQLAQTDEVMRVGLSHPLAGFSPNLAK